MPQNGGEGSDLGCAAAERLAGLLALQWLICGSRHCLAIGNATRQLVSRKPDASGAVEEGRAVLLCSGAKGVASQTSSRRLPEGGEQLQAGRCLLQEGENLCVCLFFP